MERESTFLCNHQETCPIVLGAFELKVKAEAATRLAESSRADLEAEYARKRTVMNELYAAGAAMRKAQSEYFKGRTQVLLETSKAAEARFDRAIQACRDLGKPVQRKLL